MIDFINISFFLKKKKKKKKKEIPETVVKLFLKEFKNFIYI